MGFLGLEKLYKIWDKYSNITHSLTTSINSNERGIKELYKKLEFLKIAFRKNKWFERSVEYTKKYNIYRQNYCWCIYSDTFPGKEE